MKLRKRYRKWKSIWRKHHKKKIFHLMVMMGVLFLLGLTNWFVQLARKPSEAIGLLDSRFFKTPIGTWKAYSHLFHRHSTSICTPEFLAALAQVESSGNPIARTYWTWRWTLTPWEIYSPASSARGMYQITDGTVDSAKKLCIHNGKVVRAGRWYELESCWFNSLYNRLLPSDAIEMTSAYLHLKIAEALGTRFETASLARKHRLGAVIHLCGAGRGKEFVRRGFRAWKSEVCGDTNLEHYLRSFERLKRRFEWIATEN